MSPHADANNHIVEQIRQEGGEPLLPDFANFMAAQRERIIHAADMVAQLDYWQSLAQVGRTNNWCRPELDAEANLDIREGRHPVVEAMVQNLQTLASRLPRVHQDIFRQQFRSTDTVVLETYPALMPGKACKKSQTSPLHNSLMTRLVAAAR